MSAGERIQHSGNAPATTLSGAINSSATTIVLTDGTGYPDGSVGPFWIVLDAGLSAEEKVKCASRTANTITVVTVPSSGRGGDGTSATSHSAGAVVQHVLVADEVDKTNQHINDQNDNHPSLLNVARHDTTTRHAAGTVIPVATPGNSTPSDTAAQGASGSMARSDHVHGREGFGAPAASTPSDTQTTGTATTVPRSDHKHAREGYGTPGASAPGDTTAAGTATSITRSDHKHGREGFGSPTASRAGDASADGTATTISRSDHKHSREPADKGETNGIVGTRGSQPLYTISGSIVVTTNAGGGFSFTPAGGGFTTGLETVILTLGDTFAGLAGGYVVPLAGNHTTTHIEGKAFQSGGSAAASVNVRINYILTGWD